MSSIDDGGSTHGRNILHGHPSRFVMHALPGKEAIFKAKMKIQGEMSVGDPYNYTRPVDPYAADGGSPNISMHLQMKATSTRSHKRPHYTSTPTHRDVPTNTDTIARTHAREHTRKYGAARLRLRPSAR